MSAGQRILVCDDEPQILRTLRVILGEAGFEVVTAASAEEALGAHPKVRRMRPSWTCCCRTATAWR